LRQRGVLKESYGSSNWFHTQLPPEVHQVRRHRSILHAGVEIFQDRNPYGGVSRFQYFLERPVSHEPATVARNGSYSILESEPILRAAMDLDIRQQAKHGAAPIGAPPCMGVIEATVSGLRQSTRH